jgi:class 3 adenylate cyclase/pimeloyl-ACP methyl ester carboxylesterase
MLPACTDSPGSDRTSVDERRHDAQVQASDIRYARSPGGRIAYRTVGDGPIDLLVFPAGAWNIDLALDEPRIQIWLRQLTSFARVVLVNPRGASLSDPLPPEISIEEWAGDLMFVLDAVGCERVASVAYRDIAPFILLATAANPQRCTALIIVDGYARQTHTEDYSAGRPRDEMARVNELLVEKWGTGEPSAVLAPELQDDHRLLEWFARFERATASPAVFGKLRSLLLDVDVRGLLPSIQAPTLVVAHTGDLYGFDEHARNLAALIPTAKLVERPGHCGIPWLHDVDGTNAEIRAFLTGQPAVIDVEDRYLATVMFTDLVDSTSHAAAIGDTAWRRLLDQHDDVVAQTIAAYRGRWIKSTGDGVMASFDGPARAIRCAAAVREAVTRLGLRTRAGVHTGEVEQRGDDLGGIAVAIAARVMAEADADDILVSSAVPPLVAGSGIEFDDRGVRTLKGVPGEWRILAVTG